MYHQILRREVEPEDLLAIVIGPGIGQLINGFLEVAECFHDVVHVGAVLGSLEDGELVAVEEVLGEDLVHLQEQAVAGTVCKSEVGLVLQEELPVSEVLLDVLVNQVVQVDHQEGVGQEQRVLHIYVLLHLEILGQFNFIFIHEVEQVFRIIDLYLRIVFLLQRFIDPSLQALQHLINEHIMQFDQVIEEGQVLYESQVPQGKHEYYQVLLYGVYCLIV